MRLIDADKLKTELKNAYAKFETILLVLGISAKVKKVVDEFINVIDNMPTVYPVKHGHWIFLTDRNFNEMYKCSACRDTVSKPSKYCPMCGAKMDEVTE